MFGTFKELGELQKRGLEENFRLYPDFLDISFDFKKLWYFKGFFVL